MSSSIDNGANDSGSMPGNATSKETNRDMQVFKCLTDELQAESDLLIRDEGRFNRVIVMCCYWEEACHWADYWEDEPGTKPSTIKTCAQQLGELFRSKFGFEVCDYEIPKKVTQSEFSDAIGNEVAKIANDRNSLFVFYYGGHASKKDDYRNHKLSRTFKAEEHGQSPSVDWPLTMVTSLDRTLCRKMLLLDCDFASAMADIDFDKTLRCEILAGCTSWSRADLEDNSFTKALMVELASSEGGASKIYRSMTQFQRKKMKGYQLKSDPCYMNLTSRISSEFRIPLQPAPGFTATRRDAQKDDGRDAGNHPLVISKITFGESAEEACKDFE